MLRTGCLDVKTACVRAVGAVAMFFLERSAAVAKADQPCVSVVRTGAAA